MNEDKQEKLIDFNKIFLPNSIEGNDPKTNYFNKLIEEFYNVDHMEMKSDLNRKQIVALTRAKIFASYFHSDLTDKLIQYLLELSVSNNRLGRKEFQEIFKLASNEMMTDDLSSKPSRFF